MVKGAGAGARREERGGDAGARREERGGDAGSSFFTDPRRRPEEEPASRSCLPLPFQKPMARWAAGELEDKGRLGFGAVRVRGGRWVAWGSVDDDPSTLPT